MYQNLTVFDKKNYVLTKDVWSVLRSLKFLRNTKQKHPLLTLFNKILAPNYFEMLSAYFITP